MRRRYQLRQALLGFGGWLVAAVLCAQGPATQVPLNEVVAAAFLLALPEEIRTAEGFDSAQSAGLFVGVRSFDDETFAEVPFAVDDAVDLAHLFALELRLIAPQRVTLSLAGQPQKPTSQERLRALVLAGASYTDADLVSIYELLREQAETAGPSGMSVTVFATHGVSDGDGDFLLSSDSLAGFIRRTAVPVDIVLDRVARTPAPRRLVLFDAGRERLSAARVPPRVVVIPWGRGPSPGGAIREADPSTAMSPTFSEAISQGAGQAVLSAAAFGGYAYDDWERRNGVFTAALLDGLRGGALADERGLITVGTLAGYVDDRIRDWVRSHHAEHTGSGSVIAWQTEGSAPDLPLAVDPVSPVAVQAYCQRRDAALEQLRLNLSGADGAITGAMYDGFAAALDVDVTHQNMGFLGQVLFEVEGLDGSARTQRDLVTFYDDHLAELREGGS